jgi:hypothetical protein
MKNDELLKKGFNAGYLMEKYDPQLSRTLFKSLTDKEIPYAKGYTAGVKEYILERTIEHHKSRERDMDRDFGYDR